jgi:glutamate N-acetyltransferase / amino-acid N-acetyltransferase
VASTQLRFSSREEHRAWLAGQAALPRGFRVGTTSFAFTPAEVAKPARMTLTLIALDRPTPDFAALFTRNALVGAPVQIGRRRLEEPALRAIAVNNKISNVGAPDGVGTAERLCAAVAGALGARPTEVLPASTGVIGWQLPIEALVAAAPEAVQALSPGSALPAAEGIMTTDLYPKVRRAEVGGGSIVGLAKGAGMIEPSCATMLVYLLTDLAVPRGDLRDLLPGIVDRTFNAISVDSDTSTSDTVALLASGAAPAPDRAAFARALETVCADLAEDLVRNGEGVHHVLRVRITGAPSEAVARAVGKSVVNSPLVKTAICGNDANVGRILAAIGKPAAGVGAAIDPARLRVAIAGQEVFRAGAFQLSRDKEAALTAHLRETELYASQVPADGVFVPPVTYPPHERSVDLEIDLGSGAASTQVLGADLSHEYVSENADYRS